MATVYTFLRGAQSGEWADQIPWADCVKHLGVDRSAWSAKKPHTVEPVKVVPPAYDDSAFVFGDRVIVHLEGDEAAACHARAGYYITSMAGLEAKMALNITD